jgi:peptidylprolyl isomerase
VSNPVKDRSGVGLPPKAERRALGKQAALARARARRRKRILKNGGQILAVAVAVTAIAVGCSVLGKNNPAPQSSAAAPAASVSLDPALSTKPTVAAGTGTLTELKVTTLIEGTGPVVQNGQTLSVNYVGVSYTDGKEFDASWTRNQPFSFKFGAGNVIKGWDQGLAGVKVGSRVQLDIPSSLAYGDNAGGGAPSGPLRFVVDVLSAS